MEQINSSKILVMGTGGCGSGFIWHMLKDCGLETTNHQEWIRYGGIIHAEDPTVYPAPKVIKHNGGFLCNLNTHLDNYQWEVEHIFFAVAKIDLAMRIQKTRFRLTRREFNYDHELERYYTKLGRGLDQLVERDHPFTVVQCPASILDPQYCYDKLKVALPDTSYEEFAEKHAALIIPKQFKRLPPYA
jgi:hypothetical protein